jgi:hypothetical protein
MQNLRKRELDALSVPATSVMVKILISSMSNIMSKNREKMLPKTMVYRSSVCDWVEVFSCYKSSNKLLNSNNFFLDFCKSATFFNLDIEKKAKLKVCFKFAPV